MDILHELLLRRFSAGIRRFEYTRRNDHVCVGKTAAIYRLIDN